MLPIEFLLRHLTTHWDSLAASIVNQKTFDGVTIWCATKKVFAHQQNPSCKSSNLLSFSVQIVVI
jgi:hypothetical protein